MRQEKSVLSIVWKIFRVILIAVISGYVLGVLCFWGRFQFHTYVNGVSVAGRSPGDVTLDRMMETKYTQLCLLRKDGTKELVPFGRMGVYRESDNAFANVQLNAWKWPLSLVNSVNYDLTNTLFYNREKIGKSC